MKPIQAHKLLALIVPVWILVLFACNADNNGEKKEATTGLSNENTHAEAVLSDNEVKCEAPDAKTKTEQGYAIPRHDTATAQSPINIISSNTEKLGKEQLSFSFHSDINATENLGHTIQVDFKDGSTCISNGRNYTSKQFHFHTPSEHLIDGITYPMEMHIVNIIIDSSNANSQSYLVVGVLFKMGAENKFIKEFLDKIPHEEGKKNELQSGSVKLEDLFADIPKNEMKSVYTYRGSLTTPPYTERVQWVILKHVVEASEDQITEIEKMEGNNARHVQALNTRKVYNQ